VSGEPHREPSVCVDLGEGGGVRAAERVEVDAQRDLAGLVEIVARDAGTFSALRKRLA
jgi:hypothetical protein